MDIVKLNEKEVSVAKDIVVTEIVSLRMLRNRRKLAIAMKKTVNDQIDELDVLIAQLVALNLVDEPEIL